MGKNTVRWVRNLGVGGVLVASALGAAAPAAQAAAISFQVTLSNPGDVSRYARSTCDASGKHGRIDIQNLGRSTWDGKTKFRITCFD